MLAYGLAGFVGGVLLSVVVNWLTGVFPRTIRLLRQVDWLGWLDTAIIQGGRWVWGDLVLAIVAGLIVAAIVAGIARATGRLAGGREQTQSAAPSRPADPSLQAAQINAGIYLGPNAISASGENAIVLGDNAVTVVGPAVNNGLPDAALHPDADGLFRVNGQVVCPECLRTRGMQYPLEQQFTGGGAHGTWDELTYDPAEPTNRWACSVCGTVFTQAPQG